MSTTDTLVIERNSTTPRPAATWLDRLRAGNAAAGFVGATFALVTLVVAIVAIARAGIDLDALTATSATVGPFTRTTLMALIELAFGMSLLGAAVDSDRRGVTVLGFVALLFGLVWLIEPGAFQGALGVNTATAWYYTILGVAGLATTAFGPSQA